MLWDQPSISFDELPSLQGMLREGDRSLLAQVILADHTLEGRPFAAYGEKRMRTMRKRLYKTFDELCELEVPEQTEEDGRRILLPQEVFLLGGSPGLIERWLQAALVLLDDASVVDCARAALGQRVGTYRQAKQAQARAKERVLIAFDRELPTPEAYRSLPWEKVLASKVWLGGALCRRERYMVLAEAVWEMTFYGFSQAEVQAHAARERCVDGEASCFDDAAPSVPSSDDLDLGLVEPNCFERDYSQVLSQRVAALNHNALVDLYDLQLDVAARCGIHVG